MGSSLSALISAQDVLNRFRVPREAIPSRTLKMLEHSVTNLKKGHASPPIDLSGFTEE